MDPREANKFCHRCGNKLEIKEELLQCVHCGFKLYLNPIPCNGVIIENKKKEILLVRRKIEPKKGYWDVPGGFIQAGESLEHSVKREIMEELSVEVKMINIIGVYEDTYLFQEIVNPTLGIIVTAKIVSGILKADDDVADFRFFPRNQVLKQPIGFHMVIKGLEDFLTKTGN